MIIAPLTMREAQVLQLLAWKDDTEYVAEILNLAPNTIKSHLRRISRKLETESRMEAVLWALDRGIISLHPPSPLGRL